MLEKNVIIFQYSKRFYPNVALSKNCAKGYSIVELVVYLSAILFQTIILQFTKCSKPFSTKLNWLGCTLYCFINSKLAWLPKLRKNSKLAKLQSVFQIIRWVSGAKVGRKWLLFRYMCIVFSHMSIFFSHMGIM